MVASADWTLTVGRSAVGVARRLGPTARPATETSVTPVPFSDAIRPIRRIRSRFVLDGGQAAVTSSKGESKGTEHVQRLHRYVFPSKSRPRVVTGGGVRRSS